MFRVWGFGGGAKLGSEGLITGVSPEPILQCDNSNSGSLRNAAVVCLAAGRCHRSLRGTVRCMRGFAVLGFPTAVPGGGNM